MSWVILDENNIRNTSPKERLVQCKEILENEKDASKRWDVVWILGELARNERETSFFNSAADLLVWTLENDNDGVVKHEVCYQISTCNMRNKIPDLLRAGLYNENPLARHEAIECLGFMEAFEIKDELKKALNDPVDYVKETAMCAIKRLDRMKNRNGRFSAPEIL